MRIFVPMGVTKVQLTKKPANANVTTLTLPESVNQVDAASIAEYIPSLQEYAYTDPDDSCSISYRNYKIIDGVLYSKDGTTLLSVPAGRTKKLVIPSTVTTLAKGCFKTCLLIRFILRIHPLLYVLEILVITERSLCLNPLIILHVKIHLCFFE
ncbi:MAG: hypothetical protein ACLVI9_02585 [Anaerostipes hadrus]